MYSIIIPLYNKANYIENALKSVLSQTMKQFELIIINDGSTDNSFDVVSAFDLSMIDYKIVNQANTGVSTARNNGVKLAKYPYIAFLDADDWWETTFLEEMKVLIGAYPTAEIYGSGYYIVKNNIKKEDTVGVDKDFKSGLINYCQVYSKKLCMPLWTGATIVRKNIFEAENGFKSNIKLGEDFDLWIRIALKYPVAFLKKPLSNYNQDVDVIYRAVDYFKIYHPSNFFIFNLDYLYKYELENPELKELLDKLRVYNLLPYRLKNEYQVEYKKEISKVNFKKLAFSTQLLFGLPVGVVKFWFDFRLKIGSYLIFILRKSNKIL